MPCPRQQQQQQPIVNGSMPWPQQQQQQQPQQQLISYDSDGGWVWGGINRGAGVLPPSGDGGDGGGQQRYTGGHGSVDGSSGCNISGGNGDDGYTLVVPVVVVHRRIGQWRNGKIATIIRKMIVGR